MIKSRKKEKKKKRKKKKRRASYGSQFRKMLDLQHQHNKCTTLPHVKVGPNMWGSPSCERVLCTCCYGVEQESNPLLKIVVYKGIILKFQILLLHPIKS
jgi:hypothetical protein